MCVPDLLLSGLFCDTACSIINTNVDDNLFASKSGEVKSSIFVFFYTVYCVPNNRSTAITI